MPVECIHALTLPTQMAQSGAYFDFGFQHPTSVFHKAPRFFGDHVGVAISSESARYFPVASSKVQMRRGVLDVDANEAGGGGGHAASVYRMCSETVINGRGGNIDNVPVLGPK